ncbi:FAD-dependent oxidoreductase [Brochothrix campestris]|uniref:Coenzyme A disulfide reductase n=1 Tax=Brochothrix campestris FSL F6-1037 TaxID=1265861 RepID=W7CYS6_9LIST|nr:FAD-dependent oxidoreductase [Brochothrix campestris]EUJ41900.1 coenzyme A disulfide reductase [Brochothrix campestris FSL F6-1037]
MRYVIVGGVAGGMSAATRLRRLDETAEIIIIDKGAYVSFANCGLPYYVAGEITERADLLVQTPAKLKARFNLDVRVNSEVVGIQSYQKSLTVKTATEEYQLSYDKLLLSPGGQATIPPLSGLSNLPSYTMRSVADVDAVTAFIEREQPQTIAVIGGGYIGLEMSESLTNRGIKVHLINRSAHVLNTVDEEMAVFVEQELREQAVELHLKTQITAITADQKVILNDGRVIACDALIIAAGIKPATGFLEKTPIALGKDGGIIVNEQFETTVTDIFAVGDAILVPQLISKEASLLALASPANRQGRFVADVMSGLSRSFKGTLGTSIVRVFSQTVAATGLNESDLKRLGYHYQVLHVMGKNHAGYYPHATGILLKVLFNKDDGQLYGAQAIGQAGVDKRIDVLATAIYAKLTIDQLPELELSYAPPFGVAKDVVNMAGYVGMNISEGLTQPIQWHELAGKVAGGAVLIDVRSAAEFAKGHIVGALNHPLDAIREQPLTIAKETTLIVSCQTGLRSYIAERLLTQQGYTVYNLDGAYHLYAQIQSEKVEYK